jgi:nucleoside-diphosphate-sugar epimerase
MTNWKPKYEIDEGLKKLIKWIKEGDNLKNYKPEDYNI